MPVQTRSPSMLTCSSCGSSVTPSNPPGDAALFRAQLEEVLAVGGEVVAECCAAARAERQLVADPRALIPVARHEERLGGGRAAWAAERHLRDACGGAQVPLGQRRRQGQSVGVVVEAVRRVVRRQQRRVDVHREQVAHGVAVLGAVQAVQGGPAGVGACQCRAVELGLEPRHDGVVGRLVGPGPSDRRHGAGPQLADHRFPHLRVLARSVHVQDVEGQSSGPRTLVVAGEAVPLQDGAGCGLGRRGARRCHPFARDRSGLFRGAPALRRKRRSARHTQHEHQRQPPEPVHQRRRVQAGHRFSNSSGMAAAQGAGHGISLAPSSRSSTAVCG